MTTKRGLMRACVLAAACERDGIQGARAQVEGQAVIGDSLNSVAGVPDAAPKEPHGHSPHAWAWCSPLMSRRKSFRC
jgi:hypothetical protein